MCGGRGFDMGKELFADRLFDPAVVERFLSKLQLTESGCIEIQGAQNPDGYVNISVGGREDQKKIRAHRWAFQFALGGVVLPPEVLVCHKCDNPKCVCPTHLFPGSHQDNMDDMVSKGRAAVSKGNARLELDQIKDIKYGGDSLRTAAKKHGISKSTASYIRNGRTWPEV